MKSLIAWNLILTLVVGVLVIKILILDFDFELANQRVQFISIQLKIQNSHISSTTKKMEAIALESILLSDQCELTLDLLVNTRRRGWWDDQVFVALHKLNDVKQKRKKYGTQQAN